MLSNAAILKKTAPIKGKKGRYKGTFPHGLVCPCPQDEYHHHRQYRVHIKGLIGDHCTFIRSYHLIEQAKRGRCGWTAESTEVRKDWSIPTPVLPSVIQRAYSSNTFFSKWVSSTVVKRNHQGSHLISKRLTSCRSKLFNSARRARKLGVQRLICWGEIVHQLWRYAKTRELKSQREWYSMHFWIHIGVYR